MKHGKWILAATILASSMAFIDGTVVNVALPFLQKNLNATVIGVQWVVEAYALFLAALLLVGGALGDHYGRRKIFLLGVILFALSSVVCGLAANIQQLIAARAVQGIGGALLVPGSLAIISNAFDEKSRGKAIGTWSGFSAMTTAIGPVFGGWLVEHVSWRAVFFLNVPIAFAVLLIALWKVPETREKTSRGNLDWSGAALATLGLGGIVYGLTESPRLGLYNWMVFGSLIAGVVCLGLFILNETRVKNPMVPLALFRSSNFAGANILTLFLYAALSAMMFFFMLNLVQVHHYSGTAAGASLLPFIVIMFALSRWSGGLVDRFGSRLPLIIGPVIAGVGLLLFAVPGTDAHYWTGFFPAVAILGLGMAISVAPLTTTVMGSVSQEQAGVASGINNAVSRTAGLLSIAVFGVVMLQVFSTSLASGLDKIQLDQKLKENIQSQSVKLAGIDLPDGLNTEEEKTVRQVIGESSVAGLRVVMISAAGLAFLSALNSWLVIGRSRTPKSGQHANQPG